MILARSGNNIINPSEPSYLTFPSSDIGVSSRPSVAAIFSSNITINLTVQFTDANVLTWFKPLSGKITLLG